MTDEMTTQTQRPSAVPYLLGGAAVGGTAGYFSPWGVTKPKYESFDDILKEANDTFTSAKEDVKDKEDLKKAYDEIEVKRNDILAQEKTKNEEIAKLTEKHSAYDPKLAGEQVVKDLAAAENAEKAAKDGLLDKVKTGIKDGSVEITGLSKEDAAKLTEEQLKEKAEAFIKDEAKCKEKFEAELTAVTNAKTKVTEAKTAVTNKAAELKVSAEKILSEEGKNAIKAVETKFESSKKAAGDAVKTQMEKIKTPHRWVNAAILAGTAALGALLLRPKDGQ